jgi:hypothetical protein
MIEKANKYLSSDAFAKSVNILPNYIKRKIVKFIELNSFDADQVLTIVEKFNLYNKVKKLYKKGITKVEDILSNIKSEVPGLAYESFGATGLVIGIVLVTLAFVLPPIIAYINDPSDGWGGLLISAIFLAVGALLLLSLKSPKEEEYEEKTITYKGDTVNIKIREVSDGKYEIIPVDKLEK